MRQVPRQHVLYLTACFDNAAHAARLAAADRIRLHRAADLCELAILLRIVQAPVVLVDESFEGGEWRDALRFLADRRLEVPLVVVAPLITSELWREVLLAGGFGLVKRPFAADDLTIALDSAARYLHTLHEMMPLRTA